MSAPTETIPVTTVPAGVRHPRERPLTGLGPHLVTMTALAGLLLLPARAVAGMEGEAAWHAAGMFAAGLSASLILHELAQAVVSTAGGHPVRSIHLGWLGGHVLFPETITPKVLLAAILAGPAVNLILAATLGWTWWRTGVPLADSTPVTFALAAVAATNVVLGLFNLMPAPELDGEVAISAAVEALGAPDWVGVVVATIAGLSYACGLLAVPLLLGGTLPLVVTAAAGLYGVLVLHQTVTAARHR
jgi:Zn-dependent protease